jgi:leucyl-tRNA synthetase
MAEPPEGASVGEHLDRPYRYTASMANEIETRWQERWRSDGTFETPNPSGDLSGQGDVAARPKMYVLDMFPYPSGIGLHVGHPLGYIATDVFGRFKRMTGHNVLHAFGFDAFGLPAEQFAVQTGQHPRVTTEINIATMRRQLDRLGLAHDPRRSVSTTDPAFYRWTQWAFLQIHGSWYDERAGRARPIDDLVRRLESGEKSVPAGVPGVPDGVAWTDLDDLSRRRVVDSHRLAYVSDAAVNWCPALGTVLANEEVTAEGRSERGNFPVFKRELRQWMLRITAYAPRLLADLAALDWPESIKLQQRNWIGPSEGSRITFPSGAGGIDVFTTRPETVFGATFLVLSPEHPAADGLVPDAWPPATPTVWRGDGATPAAALTQYRVEAARAGRTTGAGDRSKTGVWTGGYAINPANGSPIPVFVADYVLMTYGTGAIMGVPGQDERDWLFAQKLALPIIRTVEPPAGWDGDAYLGGGHIVNSTSSALTLDGLTVDEARTRVQEWLAVTGHGRRAVTYRLRDWLFSRQRYWGEPFPIVYDEHNLPVALPESLLPVELPDVDDYTPRTFEPDDMDADPESPLARSTAWTTVELDLGDGLRRYRRETNTMPQWAGSCWYELRYLDPANEQRLVDPDVERYWMGPQAPGHPGGVDLYVGGAEHAVLHLLYARFWHKVLFDLGHVSSSEPFFRLFNQGMIQAYAYRDGRGTFVPADEVTESGRGAFTWHGVPVTREYGKMGKSLKNMVTPDEICDSFGADTFRLYEMSMGPLGTSRPWDTRAVIGSLRFLQRLWRSIVDEQTGTLRVDDEPADDETKRLLHKTIAAVRTDLENLRANTAIARLAELNNHLVRAGTTPRDVAEPLVLMVAPLAPHVAEELWSRLGHDSTLAYAEFPRADASLLRAESVTAVVQVAGRVRDRLEVPTTVTEDELRELALGSLAVQRALDGRAVRTVVTRPPKLVNVVPAAEPQGGGGFDGRSL